MGWWNGHGAPISVIPTRRLGGVPFASRDIFSWQRRFELAFLRPRGAGGPCPGDDGGGGCEGEEFLGVWEAIDAIVYV